MDGQPLVNSQQPNRCQRTTYRGNVVNVEMGFLQALTMVTLRVRQTKEALLQERTVLVLAHNAFCKLVEHFACNLLLLVPKSKGDVLQAVRVRDTSNAVLAPAIGARTRHIVGEIYGTMSALCRSRSAGHEGKEG